MRTTGKLAIAIMRINGERIVSSMKNMIRSLRPKKMDRAVTTMEPIAIESMKNVAIGPKKRIIGTMSRRMKNSVAWLSVRGILSISVEFWFRRSARGLCLRLVPVQLIYYRSPIILKLNFSLHLIPIVKLYIKPFTQHPIRQPW